MSFQLISFIDLFQLPVTFYFNGNTKRSSSLGVLFSLAIYSFMLYSLVSSDLFFKISPIVVSQSIDKTHAERIEFKDGMFFSFGLVDSVSTHYYDPTIFTIVVRYFFNATNYVSKEIRPCKPNDFPVGFYVKGANPQNMMCLKNNSFVLEGGADENKLSLLAVSLFICDNITSKGTCKSNDEIIRFFNNFANTKVFSVYFQNSKMDLSNYKEPFTLTESVDYQNVDINIKKRYNMYLKTAIVETDDGWIFPSIKTQKNFMLDSKQFDFQLRSDPTQPTYQYIFYASKQQVLATRRYQKLPEILGGLAGMMHLLVISSMLLANLATYIDTLKLVLNRVYVFPKIISKKGKKSKKAQKKLQKEEKEEITMHVKNIQETAKMEDFDNRLITIRNVRTLETDHKNKEPLDQNSPSNVADKPEILMEQNIQNTDKQENIKSLFNNNSEISFSAENQVPRKDLKEDSFILEHQSIDLEKAEKTENFQLANVNISTRMKETFGHVNLKETSSLKLEQSQSKVLNKGISNFFRKNRKDTKSYITEIKKPTENNLQFSFLDYAWYIICKLFRNAKTLSPKHKIIKKAEETFRKDVDCINIVEKLHDLEKLKVLLLDEEQLVLFHYLSKPIITAEGHENFISDSISLSQRKITVLINKHKEADSFIAESYKKVYSERENNKINKKLIELLDEKIKCN